MQHQATGWRERKKYAVVLQHSWAEHSHYSRRKHPAIVSCHHSLLTPWYGNHTLIFWFPRLYCFFFRFSCKQKQYISCCTYTDSKLVDLSLFFSLLEILSQDVWWMGASTTEIQCYNCIHPMDNRIKHLFFCGGVNTWYSHGKCSPEKMSLQIQTHCRYISHIANI